jgi:hypothetical protein
MSSEVETSLDSLECKEKFGDSPTSLGMTEDEYSTLV